MKKNPPSETVLAIVIGFTILYLVFDIRWFILVAAGVGGLGLLSRKFADLVHLLWSYLTRALGFLSSHILLTLVFFLILSPIALIYRLVKGGGSDNIKKDRPSLFVERNHLYEGKDLENPW